MYRKFYKSLIIGDSQPTIFFIPTRNDGIMEWWNDGMMDLYHSQGHLSILLSENESNFFPCPQSLNPNIPLFQHSIIPIAELSSKGVKK
jgi:hypothetical protein